ncbi:MAG: hypothetical protein IT210_06925 [Armatimonadetes bacterium]|nr:hypothetical protein [Armatimonadota bacterium]
MTVPLRLSNEIRVSRPGEWLERGVPFPEGLLREAGSLRLSDEAGRAVPLSADILARWPDGSLKWALLQFPVSFETNGKKEYTLDWAGAPQEPEAASLRLEETPDGWILDTGMLQCLLPSRGGSLLERMQRGGRTHLHSLRAEIADGEGTVYRSELLGGLRIERQTAHNVILSRRGIHRSDDGRKFFAFLFRLTSFAGAEDIEIEYRFIHDEPFRDGPVDRGRAQGVGFVSIGPDSPGMCEVRSVRLVFEYGIGSPEAYITCSTGAAGSEAMLVSPDPIRALLLQGPKIAMYDGMIDGAVYRDEERIGTSHMWAAVGGSDGGLAVSGSKFVQNWPKGFRADRDRIVIDLWPEEAGPFHLYQGQAKSHRLKVRAYTGCAVRARLAEWHFAYQFPIAFSSPDWFLSTGALGPVFPYRPDRYPLIERRLRREFTQFLAYDRLLGMLDYGDYEQLASVSWGRESFMANCEHDFPQSVYLQFARTGSYYYLDTFEASVRHVMDMDIVHYDDRFHEAGGWREHGANHILWDTDHACHPSHMWAESLLSYYFYCGCPSALEAARGVADLIARGVESGRWGLTDARSRGWPLIALSAAHEATGEKRYAEAARVMAESFAEGPDPLQPNGSVKGGWGPIPYDQFVMTGIAAAGMARYHHILPDALSREIYLKMCDYLTGDDPRTPEGLPLAMPGNETYMAYPSHAMVYEGLGLAWELTGDTRYIEAGLRDLPENMASTTPQDGLNTPMRIRHGWEIVRATGDSISLAWRNALRFLYYADKAGLLRDF